MRIALAALLAVFACCSPLQAQTPAPPPSEEAATQAVIVKLNAYVALLNRTLRASESLARYESWVNMKSGPTGRERIVYGLYSLYDVRGEIEKARAAIQAEPPMPQLDAGMLTYIAAYEALAPTVDRADAYYERQDYKDDKMAGGKAMHETLASAGRAFKQERAKIDLLFAEEKAKSEAAELVLIEQREGRKARWHVANVMMRARQLVELLPNGDKPVVDMPVFEKAVAVFATTVREMDDYGAANPNSFFVFESRPRSFLGKLRDFRDKLAKAKGDARKGAGRDLEWLISDYNMMVSTSENATQFSK